MSASRHRSHSPGPFREQPGLADNPPSCSMDRIAHSGPVLHFVEQQVTGKCALMVDMATKYNEYPDSDSEFSIMRDCLYILASMNQYSVTPGVPPVEAERLLRLALFSNLLHLPASRDDPASLVKRRTDLASNLREDRKKPGFRFFLVVRLQSGFDHRLGVQRHWNEPNRPQSRHRVSDGLATDTGPRKHCG